MTDVVELDDHTRTASTFRGGWLAYQEEKATARRHAEEAYAEYSATREALLGRAQRERQWSTTGYNRAKRHPPDNDKALRRFRMEASENLASKARQTEQALARLDEVDKPWEPWDLHFSIGRAERSGNLVASLDGAVVERGDFTLGPVDLTIGWAERVGIVGPNGSGKSTLLDALLGRVELAAGEQRLGPGVVVGEVEQARHRLDSGRTLLDAVLSATGMTLSEARSLLAKFGLGAGEVERAARTLSAGERTRAILALLMAQGVNCLVLDEPTNHLDLDGHRAARAGRGRLRRHLAAGQPRPPVARGGRARPYRAPRAGAGGRRLRRLRTASTRAATVDKSDTSCVRRQPTWRRSPSSTPSSSSTVTR